MEGTPAAVVLDLPVDLVSPSPANDRRTFADGPLVELSRSIVANGLAQPITVRHTPDGRYEIVAGERRYRAHLLAGLSTIRAIVADLDDAAASAVMLVENLNRVDLSPVEEGLAYRARIEAGDTVEGLAASTGKTVGVIRSRLALVDLDESVTYLVASGQLWLSCALDLVGLDTNRQRIAARTWVAAADKMTAEGWRTIVADLRTAQNDEAQGGMFGDGDLDLVVEEYVMKASKPRRPKAADLVALLRDVQGTDLPPELAARVAAAVDGFEAYYRSTAK